MMNSIILIGPMGAGKSSIGRRLARVIDRPFFDLDETVQERTGVDIGFIFEKEGEAGFRRREEEALAELLRSGPAVIATGGGAILSATSRRRMREQGLVVFLETSIEWQLERTRRGTHRPLLESGDPHARLAALYAEREPLYRECANVVVNTDGQRVAAVTRAVVDAINELDYGEQ